jgi:hypothetical protein
MIGDQNCLEGPIVSGTGDSALIAVMSDTGGML